MTVNKVEPDLCWSRHSGEAANSGRKREDFKMSRLSRMETTADITNSGFIPDARTPSVHVILPRSNIKAKTMPAAFGTCAESFGATLPFGAGSGQHDASLFPSSVSTSPASTRASSLEDEGNLRQACSMSMSSQLSQMCRVNPADVILKKELCTTCKSTVSIASWQGRFVAAKQLKMDTQCSQEENELKMKDLMNEIQVLSELSHPCLVQLIGASIDVRSPILLTELMENQDVETYMLKQRIASVDGFWKPRFALAMRWALSTGAALAYLHGREHPIIHRDLKPLNMFLTKDLEVKIGDFGLAKVMPSRLYACTDQAPKMSGGVGTWRYMAPEVVRYEQYDEKVDIYAFSLIIYFIFSGRQPFYSFGEDPRMILRAYRAGEEPRPSLNSSVGTRELRHFLSEAWHVNAYDRPSAQECVQRLSVMEPPSLRKTMKDLASMLKNKSKRARGRTI